MDILLNINSITDLSLINKKLVKLSGWGLFPKIEVTQKIPASLEELRNAISSGSGIARGNGRSYGDSAISMKNTIEMKKFNRFLDFDEKSGFLLVQSGVLLSDIIKIFLPKGWFLFVTPGTKFITVGGMVASDVHGKNHIKNGSFGNYVEFIDIMNSNGLITRCSREKNSELFNWTLGGMGLTGIIINVGFRLRKVKTSWICQDTFISKNIENTIEIFEEKIKTTYCVAWIDCHVKGNKLGRSLITIGEHAELDDLNIDQRANPLKTKINKNFSIPFYFPAIVLNNLTARIFNYIYYLKGCITKKKKIVFWDNFFYPLDRINNWNKIYGKRGFAQFQCVLPLKNANKGLREIIEKISDSKSFSFLAVLKRFGNQESFFSFPMEGYTLAMDFPLNKRNLLLMDALDEITIKYGGRFYLAKDSRVKKENFIKSDNRIDKYKYFRKEGYNLAFSSSQSSRLDL